MIPTNRSLVPAKRIFTLYMYAPDELGWSFPAKIINRIAFLGIVVAEAGLVGMAGDKWFQPMFDMLFKISDWYRLAELGFIVVISYLLLRSWFETLLKMPKRVRNYVGLR